MKKLRTLFENNQRWIEKNRSIDKDYFLRMAKEQNPDFLWIGCSDSRIPANEVVGLEPGELFVHRNVANLFIQSDLNCLSVLQYAVDVLKVQDIIVCGHYGCGGIRAAMQNHQLGIIDCWLSHIRDVYARWRKELDLIEDLNLKENRLVELNVHQQVKNICHTTIAQNAWGRGQKLNIHGLIYDLSTGRLSDLQCCICSLKDVEETYLTY